jgi:DNA adenine methylase
MDEVRTILRWAGGKRTMLHKLLTLIPPRKTWNLYTEPFLGGGAMFFGLQPENAVLSDKNSDLINFYEMVKKKNKALLEFLRDHAAAHKKNPGKYFYHARDLYNDETAGFSKVYKASLFYYLNKTCFNGLYRTNSRGGFNVPYDKTKVLLEINEENIKAAGKLLRESAILMDCDFAHYAIYQKNSHRIGRHEFWFLDPPYDSKYNGYTSGKFSQKDQERLSNFCGEISKADSYFMLTSSDTPFIRELYKGCNIIKSNVQHSISSKASTRSVLHKEIIILNY